MFTCNTVDDCELQHSGNVCALCMAAFVAVFVICVGTIRLLLLANALFFYIKNSAPSNNIFNQ